MKVRMQFTVLLLTLWLSTGVVMAQTGSRSYKGEDCSGMVLQNWSNVDINLVQTRNQYAYVGGEFTVITVTNLRNPMLVGPSIPGHHAGEVVQALQYLADQGYYTVDVTVFRSGGWLISGNRNHVQEQQAAAKRAQQMEPSRRQPRENNPRASNSANGNRGNSASDNSGQTPAQDAIPFIKVRELPQQCTYGGCKEIVITNVSKDGDIVVTYKRGKGYYGKVSSGCLYRYHLGPGQEYDTGFFGRDECVELVQAWYWNAASDYGKTYGKLGCD